MFERRQAQDILHHSFSYSGLNIPSLEIPVISINTSFTYAIDPYFTSLPSLCCHCVLYTHFNLHLGVVRWRRTTWRVFLAYWVTHRSSFNSSWLQRKKKPILYGCRLNWKKLLRNKIQPWFRRNCSTTQDGRELARQIRFMWLPRWDHVPSQNLHTSSVGYISGKIELSNHASEEGRLTGRRTKYKTQLGKQAERQNRTRGRAWTDAKHCYTPAKRTSTTTRCPDKTTACSYLLVSFFFPNSFSASLIVSKHEEGTDLLL